jgi:DNA-binding MarR family transcriptional regulator
MFQPTVNAQVDVVVETGQDRSVEVARFVDQLTRFVRTVKRGMAHFGGPNREGIEAAAYGLLARLVTDGPQRTTALAAAVYADVSTVSRQSAALVRHGLVERRPDPVDGRASILAATPEGERVFQDSRKRHNENMARVLAGWSEQEVRQFATFLTRLNNDVEAHERARETSGDIPHDGLEGREP